MNDSDDSSSPSDAPPGMISVNPDVGFGPHISDHFFEQYGENPVFVAAAIDCLNARLNRLLAKAGQVPKDHEPVQHGTPAVPEAIENLLRVLDKQGVERSAILLMNSMTDPEDPQAFLNTAGSILGGELISNWLARLELEDYQGAAALLEAH